MQREQRASRLRFWLLCCSASISARWRMEAPEHNCRREKFDRAVAAEAEKRRAASEPSRAQRHDCFHAHPDESKSLNPNYPAGSL